MRRIVLAFLFISLISSLVLAQEKCGNNELQFQFKPSETISFAYLKNYGTYSWRFSTDLGISISDGSIDSKSEYSDYDVSKREIENSGNYQSLSLYAQFLLNHSYSSKVKLFYGAGPIVGYSRNYNSRTINNLTNTGKTYNENKTNTLSVGLIGSIGIWCEVSEPVSFILEYNIRATYEREIYDSMYEIFGPVTNSRSYDEEKSNSWLLNFGGIKLGVAVKL